MLQNSAQISFNSPLTKYTHHFTKTSEESYREPVCAQHLVFLRLRHLIGRKINLQRCVRYRAPCGDNNSCHVAPWRLIKWMDRLGWMDLRVLQGKVPLAVLIKVNQVLVTNNWLNGCKLQQRRPHHKIGNQPGGCTHSKAPILMLVSIICCFLYIDAN